MKKTFAVITTLIILIPYVTTFAIIVDFAINQDFIAKVLCINKDKPKLNCNGKCYLAQQLQNTQNQNNSQLPESIKNYNLDILLFISEAKNYSLTSILFSSQKTEDHFRKTLCPQDYTTDVFHPPQSYLI